jgi:7,8-dihydroneopterin aldolase/epimerase/oxygenase
MQSIVALEGLEFFAYHGFYEEERKMGNKYQVDVVVETELWEAAQKDKLSATLNYETLYKIVADIMRQPAKLLEHIAYQIIEEVYQQFSNIHSVEVNVAKHNPPVGGVCKWARVSLKK